jgi:hypothetical protein
VPYRAIVGACGKKGLQWVAACAHDKQLAGCGLCLTKDKQISSGKFCLVCEKNIGRNRRLTSRLCATCDEATPARTEYVVRPKLLALVDLAPEAADDAYFGKDCDVDLERRPDALWIVRDEADGRRILGVVKFGCDEDSHDNTHGKSRTEHIRCELGKVGNQFDSILQLVHRQDVLITENSKLKLSLRMLQARALDDERRKDVSNSIGTRFVPMYFLKWNPDAYDGPSPSPQLEKDRIPVVAARINDLFAHIRAGAPGDDARLPHVEFYYFHSKCDDIVDGFRSHFGCVVDRVCAPRAAKRPLAASSAEHAAQAPDSDSD